MGAAVSATQTSLAVAILSIAATPEALRFLSFSPTAEDVCSSLQPKKRSWESYVSESAGYTKGTLLCCFQIKDTEWKSALLLKGNVLNDGIRNLSPFGFNLI